MPFFNYDDVYTCKISEPFSFPGQAGQPLQNVSADWEKVGTSPDWVVHSDEDSVYTTNTSTYTALYKHSLAALSDVVVRGHVFRTATSSGSFAGPAARITGSGYECYALVHDASGTQLELWRVGYNGSKTVLATVSSVHYAHVRSLTLFVQGTSIKGGYADDVQLEVVDSAYSTGGVGFVGVKNDYAFYDFTAWVAGDQSASAQPPDACSLSEVGETTTTLTVHHTPPVSATYSRTRLFAATDGASPVESAQSTADEDVVLTGLTAGTEYVVFGVTEDANGKRGPVSNVLVMQTLSDGGTTQVGGVKAALRDLVGSVAGIDPAVVHTRQRDPLGKTDADSRALWESGGRINAWEIERERTSAAWGAPHHGAELDDVYVIRGWYSFDDANDSEATFAALVEGVQRALVGDRTIGGRVRDSTHSVRVYGHAQRAGRLCHYVEIEVPTRWTIEAV